MTLIDWSIIIIFFATVFGLGLFYSRKNKNISDYFLGGRNMPTWIVSFSVIGASISAGTFVGAPQLGYEGNLTYLMLSVGAIIGGIMAAKIFMPTFYKANTITIYGYIGQRFGKGAASSTSIMFLLGQLLTSGSRLFIAAIAISVMLYNDIMFPNLVISIIILGVITTIYTMKGGIKGLIVIDSIQILIVIFSGLLCIGFIYAAIPGTFSEIVNVLRQSPHGNKLKVIDTSFSFQQPYNLMGALVACTIFKFAQFSTDHDFVQRSLTCRSIKDANRSLIYSQLISLPVVLIYMIIGLLLYIVYSHPEMMGPNSGVELLKDSRQIYPQYIFNHFPPGLLGLTMVGLLSAALSSFNSSLNAMTGSFVSDIFLPIKRRLSKEYITNQSKELRQSKITILVMGIILTAFAVFAAFMQEAGGQTLVDFALGVMSFSYAGLLGVFLCARFTKRGNTRSVNAALIAGILVVLFLQPYLLANWTNLVFGHSIDIAWPWWCVIGGTISFFICLTGKPNNISSAAAQGVKESRMTEVIAL